MPEGVLLWMLLSGGLIAASPPVQAELTAGQEAFDQGDHANALVHWSLALKQARDEGDTETEVQALLRLSAVNREIGRLEEAEVLARAAQDRGASSAQLELALGLIALEGGDLKAAERHFKQAFAQAQAAQDPAMAANAAVDLGIVRMARGDLAGADKALSGAVTLFQAMEDPLGVADALTNRGNARRRQGELVQARGDLVEAVRLFRASEHWSGEADALTNLGLVLQELGQDAAAAELYQSALTTARNRRDVERQAILLLNLGTLQHAVGDTDAARRSYSEANEAFLSLGQPHDARSAQLNLAQLDGDAAAFRALMDEAEDPRLKTQAMLNAAALDGDLKLAERALAKAQALEMPQVLWRANAVVGQLQLDAGQTEEGIASLRAAVDQLERTRRALDADASQAFVTSHTQVYQALIDALLSQGDSMGAFLYAQRLQLADLGAPPIEEGTPEAERYQAMVEEEAWLQQELSRELASEGESERALALREQLATLRVAFAATVDELRASYPDFDQLVRIDPEDLEAIQRELDPGVAVLQPILFEDRLVLLVFRHDTLQAVTVEGVTPKEVRRGISRLTRSLRARMVDDADWTKQMCAQLGDWLIAPVDAHLQGIHTLVVVPADDFQQLPFSLLVHEGRYLIEDHAVVGVTHVGSLRHHGVTETRFRVDGRGLLLIGNPDGSLPQAEAEVQAIARRYPGSTMVVGALGGREDLITHTGDKQTIHLATHGVIDPDRPTRSYLVIGDSEQTSGRLAYGEIPGLAPYLEDARLVVLSACESGLPVHPLSHEGSEVAISINGLSAQFRRAGVETLVASLWKVDDAGTRALMEGFYEELSRGTDVAHAMQRAQQAMVAEGDLSHPWFWGAFVVMGDWR